MQRPQLLLSSLEKRTSSFLRRHCFQSSVFSIPHCSLLQNSSSHLLRGFSSDPPVSDEVKEEKLAESPPEEKKKRMRRREKYGTYGWGIEDEVNSAPVYEGHLYNARETVEEWMGKKTLQGLFPEDSERELFEGGHGNLEISDHDQATLATEGSADPPGNGPILRWETRMILGPGPSAWHPANRKVKVSVTVAELDLTPLARERLLAMVGPRYRAQKDELTIISERHADREENRKDVLRILLDLLSEARKADDLVNDSNRVEAA